MDNKDYRRVACSFYDRLEELATLRRETNVIINDNGNKEEFTTRFVDFQTRPEGEFAILEDGREVRLDHIESIEPTI